MAGLAALYGQQPQSLKSLYVDDPRAQMAQLAIQQGSNMAPAQGGWGEALARAFQGGMGGYMQGQIKKDVDAREAAKAQTMATALEVGRDMPAESKTYGDGTTINFDARNGNEAMINALGSNPDTAPIGMAVQASMMDNQLAQNQEFAKMKLANELKSSEPMTPYQQAQIGIDQQKLSQGSNGISYTMPDGTEIQIGGNGNKEFGKQVGKNLGSKAAPEDNPVAKLTSTIQMAKEAKRLNEVASGGYGAKAQQLIGRATNDAVMSEGMMKGRDAYSKIESLAATMGAEALKPLMGSAQLSNVDVSTAKTAASFDPNMTTRERGERINQLEGVLTRKRDLAAAEQEAARQGRMFGEPEIRQFYAQQGIDYDTGAPIKQGGLGVPSVAGSSTKPQQTKIPTAKGQFDAAAAKAAGYTDAEIQQFLQGQ